MDVNVDSEVDSSMRLMSTTSMKTTWTGTLLSTFGCEKLLFKKSGVDGDNFRAAATAITAATAATAAMLATAAMAAIMVPGGGHGGHVGHSSHDGHRTRLP